VERRRNAELAAAIASHLGARPSAVREILGRGSVNCVFDIDVAGGERWIVRFSRDPLATDHFPKEAWCLQAARRHGVPVAEVVGVGTFESTSFLVQSFVVGEDGDHRRGPELWRALGACARAVNTIPLDESAPEELFGRFGRDCRASWSAHVRYNIEQLAPNDPLLGLGVYARSDQCAVRTCVESLGERITEFALSHGDLVPQNVLLPEGGAPVLIDWGSACVGPAPFVDYLRVWAAEAEECFSAADFVAFADGYGTAPEPLLVTLADLWLLSRLDLVRWALDRRVDRVAEIAERSRLAVRDWLRTRGGLFR
jgi:Ser/Thr protein kinase RdoA (MazF antagonist)